MTSNCLQHLSSGDNYQHHLGFILCADFLERFSLLYLKRTCTLLTDALAAVLMISLCSLRDVRLLPLKKS